MRNHENAFHLAIPCKDLEAAEEFYVNVLGCLRARKYSDRVTLNFFGDQVVCHLAADAVPMAPQPYPRHFGVTFRHREDFDALVTKIRDAGSVFLEEPHLRFEGMREEHLTLFICDPSNNVIEFKYYFDPSMMY
jgi:extradiol dioxygenase family protein